MTTAPTIVGIDLGKNWFHLIGLDARGATVLRKKIESLATRRVRGHGSRGASSRPSRVQARSTGVGSSRRRDTRSAFCPRNS